LKRTHILSQFNTGCVPGVGGFADRRLALM
jgi:hypothetical protein